jgi:hypothetical protein
MNEPFIVDDDIEPHRSDGIVLTGWETVIFEVEDEPGYVDGFDSDSS